MRVLVLCDDYWHPARTPRAGLAQLEANGFQFDWLEDAHEWSAEHMAAYPVVLLTKSNNVSSKDTSPWMTPATETAFRDYVSRGGGLLVIHSGSADYIRTTLFRALLGGVFTSHPAQCRVTIEPQTAHPIDAGIGAFDVFDEHYFMEMDDANADIFLTTASEHGEQPGGWTRSEGDGRVCVLTPGHNLEVWLHPSYQTLLSNALRWCRQI